MNPEAVSLIFLLILLALFINEFNSQSGSSSPAGDQVFINFRGEELRYGFVSHLGEALKKHKINFFIDKHEERGKDLQNLFKRIDESKMALVIFSPRYAESPWCLDELVRIMERVKIGKLRMVPIFYKVEPGDVKKRQGVFGYNFWELAKNSDSKIDKWGEALLSATNKMGLTLAEQSYENDFIHEIVKEVKRAL